MKQGLRRYRNRMMELILEEEKITPNLIPKMRDAEAWERELEQ
jgi:hypothetical protein